MINHAEAWTSGWTDRWIGEGMWIWKVIDVLVAVLPVIVINNQSKKIVAHPRSTKGERVDMTIAPIFDNQS